MDENSCFKKLSIGVDLVEIERFCGVEEKKRFLENNFTKKEITQCLKKPDRAASFAVRFAAKEAVAKSIDLNLKFNKIEVLSQESGAPRVNFLDKKAKQKYASIVSLTHTRQFAQAICLTLRI